MGVGVGDGDGVGVGVGVGAEVKAAVSEIGPFIVIETGFVVPVNEPLPVPVQFEKAKPAFGVPAICTLAPLLKKPLAGATVPPVPAVFVSMNWVVKFTV